MHPQIEHLYQLGLFDFPAYFSTLDAPQPGSLRGLYRGYFVGPAWFRKLARPLLTITGMGDWRGKFIDSQGKILNLVQNGEVLVSKLPMELVEQDSLIDGKPGVTLRYEASNPLPWPWVIDEMRRIQADWVLGMTILQRGPLRQFPLPFVLQSVEAMHGF